jgi:hypothetical protein
MAENSVDNDFLKKSNEIADFIEACEQPSVKIPALSILLRRSTSLDAVQHCFPLLRYLLQRNPM